MFSVKFLFFNAILLFTSVDISYYNFMFFFDNEHSFAFASVLFHFYFIWLVGWLILGLTAL